MKLVSFLESPGVSEVRVGELQPDGAVSELEAPGMIEWLAGHGRRRTGVEHRVSQIRLLGPLPRPPSVRDFYAYEGHVAAGFGTRGAEIPEAWYQAPAFYFSNPASILGPDEPVHRPAGSEMLDFELEIAAAIDGNGELAGFMLMNDWSARDIQRRERAVGLGPVKAKDFGTSLGPWLVTPDELPYDGARLDLEATVTVNGTVISRARSQPMYFSWPQLRDHAARGTRLTAGDVLGSGTLTGGCLLELGPIDGHWIEPGDEVVLSAPGLGELRTPVAQPS